MNRSQEMKTQKKAARRNRRYKPYSKQRNTPGGKGTLNAGGSAASAYTTLIVEPWMPAFPARIVRRLRYADNDSLTCTSGAVATWVLRANDLFDPDLTGTGHQPMGFDQLMVWYNHFCVVRSKLLVTFCNTSAGNGNPVACIRQDASATPLTVPSRIQEMGGCTLDTLGHGGFDSSEKTLVSYIDMAKLQGVSQDAITADPSLRGDAATSPTELTYFHIAVWDTAAITATITFQFILEQEAVFMEPRDLTQS